jgi:hypothetical protein
MKIIILAVLAIATIIFILDIVRELLVLRDIKSVFTCKHCNTFNDTISAISNCKKCNRKFDIQNKTWEHFLICKINWTTAVKSSVELKWKEYKRYSIIEITIDFIATVILISSIALNLL